MTDTPQTRAEESDEILVEVQGPVATIILNRPARLNALMPATGPRYAEILRELDQRPDIRAIVVTGAGRGFCSGADLDMLQGPREELIDHVLRHTWESLPLVALTLSTPVATAINGPCAGLGFVLAVSADIRFVHPEATLSTTFARLGLVAEYGIAWLLPRLIGLPAATDLLLSGRTITGREAHNLGLAQSHEDPRTAAEAWAQELASTTSPASVAAMKRQLLDQHASTMIQAINESLVAMSEAFSWPDLTEALTARLEKRPSSFPEWPSPT